MIAGPAEFAGRTVSARFRSDQGEQVVSWTLPGTAEGHADDATLVASLLPAMAAGEPLTVEPAVSARLLSNVPTIQDVFETWSREKKLNRGLPSGFRRVPVHATSRAATPPSSGRGCATFFTGGVDSFYTAIKRRDELTGLVFVHGFDVPLAETALRERVVHGLRRAADGLGLPLLEVETDVRTYSDRSVRWVDYHGAALASVALLLAPWFRRIYVPATMTYGSLDALGSHPLVDPLWSTDDIELVHDGCEASRLEKLRTLVNNDAALAVLRVCPRNWGGEYNCGRCEKCLRTMVAVRLLGPPQPFASLPDLDALGLRRVARTRIPGNGATWRVYLRAADGPDGDPALARALRRALRRRQLRDVGRSVVRRGRRSAGRSPTPESSLA